MAKSLTALTKAEEISVAVVAGFVRYKEEWDNGADNAEGAKKELADAGRHRKSGDEIRRRQKPISSAMTTHDRVDPHPPLKDDPRFSTYFRNRSSVPRSWIERAVDMDDRNVTILDLDPDKSLASQTGDECEPALTPTGGFSRVLTMKLTSTTAPTSSVSYTRGTFFDTRQMRSLHARSLELCSRPVTAESDSLCGSNMGAIVEKDMLNDDSTIFYSTDSPFVLTLICFNTQMLMQRIPS